MILAFLNSLIRNKLYILIFRLLKKIRNLVEFCSDNGGKFILIDDFPLACGFKEWHANLMPRFVSKENSLQDRETLSNLFKKI